MLSQSNPCYTTESIGNSGNRTEEQIKRAQEIAHDYLSETGNDIVVFTDGSALPNPGPCGAGVCIYWAGLSADYIEFAEPVSEYSTSYHGELRAIEVALQKIAERTIPSSVQNMHYSHLLRLPGCHSCCNIT